MDQLLLDEAKTIHDYVTGVNTKYNSSIFDLTLNNITIQNQSNPEVNELPGIYIFKVINSTVVQPTFDNVPYAAKTNDNLNGNIFNKGDYLYLGKTEKGLCIRLNGHLIKCGTKTYSIKMFDKNRQYLFGSFSLYIFALKKNFKNTKKYSIYD